MSETISLWMALKVGEAVLRASKDKEAMMFEKIKENRSWVHVYLRRNDRGRYLELKMPCYETCNDAFLEITEVDDVGRG